MTPTAQATRSFLYLSQKARQLEQVRYNLEKGLAKVNENKGINTDVATDEKVEKSNKIEYNKSTNDVEYNGKGLFIENKEEYGSLRDAIRKEQASNPNFRGHTFIENGKYFYVYDSQGFDDYTVKLRTPIVGNEDYIDSVKEVIRNENNRHTETIDSIIDKIYSRRSINSGNNVDIENGKTTRRDDRLYNKQQEQSRQRNDNEENVRFSRELENSSFSLNEQLEKNLEKTVFNAEKERQGMIDLFNSYLEENDITNPTQEDIDNSLDIYGFYEY